MTLLNLSIATITLARNEDEELLLRKSLEQLAKLNIPVFVTDGGSADSFLAFLKAFPHFTILRPDGKGLWAQVKSSLKSAYDFGSDFVFYTEPDKFDFFQDLSVLLESITADKNAGIFLASRSKKGFLTFPEFQRMTETTINNCCAEIIGKKIDYCYGPFLLNRLIIPHLLTVQNDIGWGWRPLAFGIAHRLGFTVNEIEKDFSCPPDQREDNESERLYRVKQLSQNIQGIVLSKDIVLESM